MRGDDQETGSMFGDRSLEVRIPSDHPLRPLRAMVDDAVWVPTTFTKNRDRLLEGDVAQAFFDAVLARAQSKRLSSAENVG
jgi:hypothetical protein